ncbi:hypothetical protein ACFLZW_03735 [Chloroflexota bacterium]
METRSKGLWPALTLFFLSPAIGELLSGSAPPAEFFNPFGLLLLSCLYGSGALLIRELRHRWNKGWPTVLALGAAYGIIEEGLMVKSFFDPNWMDLDILGVYGRWAGVNWVWSLQLTIYHAVISIAIPILLVELLFPAQRRQRWLGRRAMALHSFLLAAVVIVGFLLLTTYRPPLLPYLLAIIAVILLVAAARRLPVKRIADLNQTDIRLAGTRKLFLAGFGANMTFFMINWVLPNLNFPVVITILFTLLLVVLAARWIGKQAQSHDWGDKHRLALACGALGFFILLAPLQELDKTRLDNTGGMALTGFLALLFLIWLWRRVRNTSPNSQSMVAI